MQPHSFEDKYTDAYSCMLDGYTRSYDKIVELGKDDVNKFNIYIKFGCYPEPVYEKGELTSYQIP